MLVGELALIKCVTVPSSFPEYYIVEFHVLLQDEMPQLALRKNIIRRIVLHYRLAGPAQHQRGGDPSQARPPKPVKVHPRSLLTESPPELSRLGIDL